MSQFDMSFIDRSSHDILQYSIFFVKAQVKQVLFFSDCVITKLKRENVTL